MYINRRAVYYMWDLRRTPIEKPITDKNEQRDFLEHIIATWCDDSKFLSNETRTYLNIPISFDIETTSYIADNGNKSAWMYIWQMSINGGVILGRTWDDYYSLLVALSNTFFKNRGVYPDGATYIPIYVHNLGFEFQFIRKFFDWDEVFAIKNRRPIYARSNIFEYRCSYFLSNANLEYLGSNMLHRYKVEKLKGDLDYSLSRLSTTPMSRDELEYCINDVLVVTSYIQELIEDEGGIQNIPYTSTGFVRNYVRDKCYPVESGTNDLTREGLQYKAIMRSLTIDSVDFYKMCKRAFMGGFTHASCAHVGEILQGIHSKDIASSYPFTILAKQFPMTKFRHLGSVDDLNIFKELLSTFCCMFDVTFYNLKPNVIYENILSKHKCYCEGEYTVNNGRLVCADICSTTLTDVDWEWIVKFYSFDSFKVTSIWVADRGYLPKPIIESTLDFYEGKTSLKGVPGQEVAYMKSKNRLNSIFGMMVTDIFQDQYTYSSSSDEWSKGGVDEFSQLSQYNKTHSRFLYYPWGIYITAYARSRLFSAIYELQEDYVYSDTDSVKYFNYYPHERYFIECNTRAYIELAKMCTHYKIDFERCRPATPSGDKKLLGVWEDDGNYKYFKTLGAKRYMYTDSTGNNLSLTVSGLNKNNAVPYLLSKYGIKGSFKMFDEGLIIPKGHAGKLLHTYIDDEQALIAEDYLGNKELVETPSSVHLEPEGYYFSIAADYLRFISQLELWNK